MKNAHNIVVYCLKLLSKINKTKYKNYSKFYFSKVHVRNYKRASYVSIQKYKYFSLSFCSGNKSFSYLTYECVLNGKLYVFTN